METDQIVTYRERSSSSTLDDVLADLPVEEVAGQDVAHQASKHSDDRTGLDSADLDLAALDWLLLPPTHM
uniref:Uncharacterized protein n=1 Tax=Cannabis sativa TaxID=3483 RepID=A0A803PCB6_CANSA